jgi:bifunctional UDP-N-acetylglucosamine pyrophosphorylase / glucosamine-1-phosphate N-acetyltransferase
MTKTPDMNFTAVILAAGKGTRMKSELPKVLHELLKKPMLWYLLETFRKAGFDKRLVVTGHGHELLENRFPDDKDDFIIQDRQLGTGHALQTAWPAITASQAKWVVVANGDTPLVGEENLKNLTSGVILSNADAGLISLKLDDPSDYGRVLRDDSGQVTAVIEARDYREAVYGPCSGEINSGIYLFRTSSLAEILFNLDADNEQKELYITQLIELACKRGMLVTAVSAGDSPKLLGINSPAELVAQEEYLRAALVERLIDRGVIIRNKDQVRIGPEVVVEPGADITGPCEIYGDSLISGGARINSHCYIESSRIGRCEIFSFSHIHGSDIKDMASIGPFARLRPGTVLMEGARTGNFVEIKNSTIGKKSKVNHLSYIGDTEMGPDVNIGAGTITCNYDGREKHKTIIGGRVFIGSNTSLVAPVRLGDQSLVGAGSTITSDVPEGALSIARSRQKNLEDKNPLKKR